VDVFTCKRDDKATKGGQCALRYKDYLLGTRKGKDDPCRYMKTRYQKDESFSFSRGKRSGSKGVMYSAPQNWADENPTQKTYRLLVLVRKDGG